MTASTAPELHFTDDPAGFLAAAAGLLAAQPVLGTVVASVAHRAADAGRSASAEPFPSWWLTVRDPASGEVVGAAMRTAPFAPHPPYVLPMPDEAARALARALHARGERLGGVNGSLPAARVVAEEAARLAGGEAVVHEHLRLWELGELAAPPRPSGALRAATEDDVALCVAWFAAFGAEAAAQGGRAEPLATEEVGAAEMRQRVAAGSVWLWEDRGRVVHLTAHTPPAYGVARVGPVYTPREHRGHGYASAAVAEVSARLRDGGSRVCLFTDQANPTSNKIYAALGYRPVTDTANLLVTTPAPA